MVISARLDAVYIGFNAVVKMDRSVDARIEVGIVNNRKSEACSGGWAILGGVKWGVMRVMLSVMALIVLGVGIVAYLMRFRAAREMRPHSPAIYDNLTSERLYSPFHIEIDPMERLLLINFTEDPDTVYVGFEPQVFDDPVHGKGLIVIAWRVDGKVDVYHQPGLNLNPDIYDIAGDGLAHMVERPLADAYFTVTDTGVDTYFAFDDLLGRPVEVMIREHSPRRRRPFGLLAPMGAAATKPSALPLVMLHDFYFVRRAGTEFTIRVDGDARKMDTLPLPIDRMSMYFTRYSPDPLIATLNPAFDGQLLPLVQVNQTQACLGETLFDLVKNGERTEIAQMRRAVGRHEVRLAFAPALPNPVNLAVGAQVAGRFTLAADSSIGTLSGEYALARQGDHIEMRVVPSGGWQPNESKLSVNLIYRMASIFTTWPKTYLWSATLDVTDPEHVTLQSAWQRTE